MLRPGQRGPVRVPVPWSGRGQRRATRLDVLTDERTAGVRDVEHAAGPDRRGQRVRVRRRRERAGPGRGDRAVRHLVNLIGHLEHVPVGRPAFDGEAVQQGGPGPATLLQGQLPGQVGRVLQAGVQPLTAERAGQVTGVAEQETPLVGQVRGHPAVHPEDGRPAHVGDLDDVARDAVADRRGDRVRGWCTGQRADLGLIQIADDGEPALAGQRRQQHIALRGGDQRSAVPRQPAAYGCLGHQRGARVGRAGQVLVHRMPGWAVRAARSDHPLDLGVLHLPGCVFQVYVHVVIGLGEGHHGHAALHGPAELGQPVGEQLLGPPLRQAALEIPAAACARVRRLADAAAAWRRRAGRNRGAPSWPAPGRAGPPGSGSPAWPAAARWPGPAGAGVAAARRHGWARRGAPAPRPKTAPMARRRPPARPARPNPPRGSA